MAEKILFSKFTKYFLVIILLFSAIFIIFCQWYITHKNIAGGYIEGSEGYSGYTFAEYNNFTSKDECEYAKDPAFAEFKTGQEFMEGCHKYLKDKSP
ncbi:hypothetical protein LVY74_13715 [Acinetobacter sp. ME22]|uniref:hypothetical protein n=1 Tax=Acinetobacter sp. ME22 TaxID=2904802 RepID=UPI001EDAADE4|nr:hypothetical protein [Acinetobacter sp. ME22]MCG2574604.1 hypothetical protein [Acinetobacter sp. ME22]